jgi:hypothetical protein
MGSRWYYVAAASIYRMIERPFVIGGVGIAYGYLKAALSRHHRYDDPEYLRYLRRYELRSLLFGRKQTLEQYNGEIREMSAHMKPRTHAAQASSGATP